MAAKRTTNFFKVNLLVAGLLFIGVNCFAQGYYWEDPSKKKWFQSYTIDAGAGLTNYFGDIQNLKKLNGPALGYGASFSGNFNERFSVGLQYQAGGLKGKRDYHSTALGPETLSGKVKHYHGLFYFHALPNVQFKKKTFRSVSYWTKLNAYVFLGGGYLRYKTTVTPGAESISAVRSITKGTISVPYGLGAKYRFDPRWSFGLEFGYTFILKDDLDATIRSGTDRDTYSMLTAKVAYSLRTIKFRL